MQASERGMQDLLGAAGARQVVAWRPWLALYWAACHLLTQYLSACPALRRRLTWLWWR